MKKKIICLMLTVVLALLTVSPAYATVEAVEMPQDEWVLSPDGQKITHGDKTYILIETYFESFMEDDNWDYYDLTFADPRSAELYDMSYVSVNESLADVAIEAGIYKNGEYSDYYLFVEEAYYEEFLQLEDGEAKSYITFNDYNMVVSISPEEYEEWSSGDAEEMTINELDSYYSYMIHGCITKENFGFMCGYIYQNLFTDELYLLRLDENSNPYDSGRNVKFTVYELEDGELKDRLIENYNYLPEDELDWLVSDEPSKEAAGVFSVIVFGVIPLAVVIFAVVMLIIMKERKYRRPFIILLSGASAVLVSCIAILAILA